ncbi:hypothetical protein FQZ97_805630 [compost metagenome]
MWMMPRTGRMGRHNVEISGRVGLHHPLGQAEAENLVQPLANLAGGVQGSTRFYLAHQVNQVGTGDFRRRALADGGDDVVVQVQTRLVGGRFGPAGRVVGVPLLGQLLECVALRLSGAFLGLLVQGGVYPIGNQRTRSGAQFSRLRERDLGVSPQADHFRLASEAVAEAPELAASGGDFEAQALGIGEAIQLLPRLGGTDGGVCERHGIPRKPRKAPCGSLV